ncbi:MAG: hypothetical protein AB1402_03005 [Bacillota bacterium]
MRNALREKLISEIPALGGRALEPHAADKDTEKPYLVIRQGVDAEESAWAGWRRVFEIYPYVLRTSFTDLDVLVNSVVAALDKQLIGDPETEEVFTCNYLGPTSPDFVDDDWDALTRPLRFAAMALQPVDVPETVQDDPWLQALARWIQGFMPGWNVYLNGWPLGYVRPAVLIRVTDIQATDKSRAAYELRKHVAIHLVGLTPNGQLQAVLRISQDLTGAVKIPIDAEAKDYMTAVTPRADLQADAFRKGQVSLVLTKMVARPQPEVSLIQKVAGTGEIK